MPVRALAVPDNVLAEATRPPKLEVDSIAYFEWQTGDKGGLGLGIDGHVKGLVADLSAMIPWSRKWIDRASI